MQRGEPAKEEEDMPRDVRAHELTLLLQTLPNIHSLILSCIDVIVPEGRELLKPMYDVTLPTITFFSWSDRQAVLTDCSPTLDVSHLFPFLAPFAHVKYMELADIFFPVEDTMQLRPQPKFDHLEHLRIKNCINLCAFIKCIMLSVDERVPPLRKLELAVVGPTDYEAVELLLHKLGSRLRYLRLDLSQSQLRKGCEHLRSPCTISIFILHISRG